jgi:hypothetical protein
MNRDAARDPRRRSTTWARRWKQGLLVVLIVVAAGYLAVCWSIGAGVRAISDQALRAHPGEQSAALAAFVESEHESFRDRNRAIWALGQLGDRGALPVLEKYYTGSPPGGKEDQSHELSQYELMKAIALCKGATNITALVWRHGALAAKGRR